MIEKGVKQSDMKHMKDSYVIFICENDIMKLGNDIYHFERKCNFKGKEYYANDGNHILYVNGNYADDTPVGKLVHDLKENDYNKIHYEIIKEAVMKEKKEDNEMHLTMEDIYNEVLDFGKSEGKAENKIETAISMLKKNFSIKDIMEICQLSKDKVLELQKGL